MRLSAKSSSVTSLPWSDTFHSVGARLLRDYAERIGLDASFTIHDRGDSEDLMVLGRHELGFSGTTKRFPKKSACLSIYSRVINTRAPLDKVLRKTFPWCATWEAELKCLFGRYVEAKQAQNVLDYDDLLLFWSEMVTEPTLAAELSVRFDHVLVDEYQDTNRLQASILLGLKPDGRGVTAVGDDAQSIYSFRGATVRNILDFPKQFSQSCRLVTLDRNYRSAQPILAVSNAVIGEARERHTKRLWTEKIADTRPQLVMVPDEADEARWVADRLLAHREAGLKLTSQAVLFRTSSHSAVLEVELARRGIPFVKFGGLKFLEASHVKDMLATLRFAQNPRGRVAGFRVLQLTPGIGPVTAAKLLDAMAEAQDPNLAVQSFQPPTSAAAEWHAFAKLYAQLRGSDTYWLSDLGLANRWYLPHLERLHDDSEGRAEDVDNLERMAGAYASRERFLTDLTLDPPESTSDQSGVPGLDEDYAILSTIHSVKGQEWNAVFVLRAVDGCIPSDMATGSPDEIEEERRLLYVAMTRAKDFLHVMQPHRFYVKQQRSNGDRHMYALRTRFIHASMLGQFDLVRWPEKVVEPPNVASAGPQLLAVRDRARAAWK